MASSYAAGTKVPTDRRDGPQRGDDGFAATLAWSMVVTPQLRFAVYADWHVEHGEAVTDQWGYEVSRWDDGCYNVARGRIQWGYASGQAAVDAVMAQLRLPLDVQDAA